MPKTLFISDLHLSRRATRAGRGVSRVRREVRRARPPRFTSSATCSTSGSATTSSASRSLPASRARFADLARSGTPVYLQHGNRDFLIGRAFCPGERRDAAAGLRRARRPGTPHPAHARRPAVHRRRRVSTLSRVLAESRAPPARAGVAVFRAARDRARRCARAAGARSRASPRRSWTSTASRRRGTARAGVTRLIHGHTHRPASHTHLVDGRPCERWVLADWYRRRAISRLSESGTLARDT